MDAIVRGRLRAEGGTATPFEVVNETDDICAPCPKRIGKLCMSQTKINALDTAHAEALDIKPGDQLSWGEALMRMKSHVQPSDLQRICKGCSWLTLGLCEAALKRLHDTDLNLPAPGDTPAL